MKSSKLGFTLIELMIVVAIIGILAAVAIPKFADLIDKSKDGATKGALSSIRSAIQVYYGDNEGWFPADTLAVLTLNGKYIGEIPAAKAPGTGHAQVKTVAAVTGGGAVTDAPGWAYFNDPGHALSWGNVAVSCTHEDVKGRASADLFTPWSTL
ncbi:MAG: prepilin-type N-terminal cleavage/methylation domain-containing protein [Elusimicrobiales bacterium]|nr:prepilin-type N-terminal cleavage/methylation domain-containing protein [Elusimicrobiales bacterium]